MTVQPRYRALLIGNSTFPFDNQNLQTLVGPVNDIAQLRSALTDRAAGLFQPDNVTLVAERTASEIRLELETFFHAASREERLLLYYSGHGLLNYRSQLYLSARDTRTDRLVATAVSASDISAMIDDSAAATTIIVLDCCHSGAFKGGDYPAAFAGDGRFVLTSCRSGELANDAARVNQTSMFTQHLVEGLTSKAPDRDGDGYVGLSELYAYVHDCLVSEGRQIPQQRFTGGGDVAIARRTGTDGGDAPILFVSQTVIALPDVEAGEIVPTERVYVHNHGGGTLDWAVDSTADWLAVEREGDFFTITADPQPGMNRGNVLVHDRLSGASETVRVSIRVRASGPQTSSPGSLEPHRPAAPVASPSGNREPQSEPDRLDGNALTDAARTTRSDRDGRSRESAGLSNVGRPAKSAHNASSLWRKARSVHWPVAILGRVSAQAHARRIVAAGLAAGVLLAILMWATVGALQPHPSPMPSPPRPAGHWVSTGSMLTPRRAFAATALQDGRVLVTGGITIGTVVTALAELYDPHSGSWSAAQPMATARSSHTATLLRDGRVLVAGGYFLPPQGGRSIIVAAAEVYDPAKNAWSPAGTMSAARLGHAAARLADGRVLVVGGDGDQGPLASAEYWSSGKNDWAPAPGMSIPRENAAVASLPDGHVLISGGRSLGGPVSSSELFDPSSERWAPAGSMSVVRVQHTATALKDGAVLVAGGGSSTSEVWAASGGWKPVGPMAAGRSDHVATLLADGRVLVVGGLGPDGNAFDRPGLASSEVYDPGTLKWSDGGRMSVPRWDCVTVTLNDGRVLVAGGQSGPLGQSDPLPWSELWINA
jgi:N-acetylneuraminic acid mutarotase